ncbi:hypothetical protein LCGC14_2035670 [marine sediment metagenome]|uniref:Uncharacterized protein n=1 Tax=marine sediment metagenome TaxID=412755 RepID=A0A0F9ETB3_9ZZZZ
MKITKSEQEKSIKRLRVLVKEGDTIYTTLKHVSRSGMSRSIDVHIIKANKPRWLSRSVAEILNWGFDEKREAVKVSGCGMDMGFHLVYTLSSVLFPNGSKTLITGRNGDKKPEKDGGYLLEQVWM